MWDCQFELKGKTEMIMRTESEREAYLDGYKMCADCIKEYLSEEGKEVLQCLLTVLMAVNSTVETEENIDEE